MDPKTQIPDVMSGYLCNISIICLIYDPVTILAAYHEGKVLLNMALATNIKLQLCKNGETDTLECNNNSDDNAGSTRILLRGGAHTVICPFLLFFLLRWYIEALPPEEVFSIPHTLSKILVHLFPFGWQKCMVGTADVFQIDTEPLLGQPHVQWLTAAIRWTDVLSASKWRNSHCPTIIQHRQVVGHASIEESLQKDIRG